VVEAPYVDTAMVMEKEWLSQEVSVDGWTNEKIPLLRPPVPKTPKPSNIVLGGSRKKRSNSSTMSVP